MSLPTMMGLETALRGLNANQAAIDTTGQNIANANTPGYSRQTVNLTESPALTVPSMSVVNGNGAQVGTGVDTSSITRIHDQFLDVQYRAQSGVSGSATQTTTTLGNVQNALDEPTSDGISSQLTAFWTAWNGLATNPTNAGAEQAVIGAGQTLTSTINQLDSQLATIQSQTASQYTTLTGSNGQVQTDAQQIASLNSSIAAASQSGLSPNNLLDQRDQLIDQLSSLANVSVTTQDNGMVNVSFGDAAQPLVSGSTVNWPQTLTSAAGGQLGALLNLSGANGQIAGYRASLNNVATSLISTVNSLQPSSPFFSGNSAATIAVSATGSTLQPSSTGDPGGNDLAQQIANLSGGAVDQSYSSLVTQVGGDVASATATQTNASSLLNAINNQRESVSGVSLDEEMTNLLTFQRGYQASARMMTTVDSMLDTLINHTGSVGL